jgi:hypothetical protein
LRVFVRNPAGVALSALDGVGAATGVGAAGGVGEGMACGGCVVARCDGGGVDGRPSRAGAAIVIPRDVPAAGAGRRGTRRARGRTDVTTRPTSAVTFGTTGLDASACVPVISSNHDRQTDTPTVVNAGSRGPIRSTVRFITLLRLADSASLTVKGLRRNLKRP